MDSAYIRSHNVLDRFVMRQLEGEELEQFELYVLENPEIVDEIEYARGMQKALCALESELRPRSIHTADDTRVRWLFGREHALAATVLLAVAIAVSGSLWLRNSELADALSAQQHPVTIASRLWLEAKREGPATDMRVVEHVPGSALLLRVVPGLRSSGDLAVTIDGRDTDFSWRTVVTTPGPDGIIDIVITDIPAGMYWLSIESTLSAEPPTRFEFEIVAAQN